MFKKCSYARMLDENSIFAQEIESVRTTGSEFKVIVKCLELGIDYKAKGTVSRHIKGDCSCSFTPEKYSKEAFIRSSTHEKREVKIAVVDIERAMGYFEWENYRGSRVIEDGVERKVGGLTISGDFWSLNDYMKVIGRIPWEAIKERSRNICAAWGWIGSDEIHFASEWDDGRDGLAKKLWHVLDKADIVVGQNMRNFDRKHIQTELLMSANYGNRPPSPFKVIDTLTILRSEFAFESNKLDAACTFMGLPAKTDHLNYEFTKAAVNGDKEAQKRMEEYNKGDIIATTELYLKLLPWIKNHPNVAPIRGALEVLCQRCGSDDVTREGYFSPAVLVYRKYRCNTCGGNFRSTHELKGATAKNI